MLQLLKELQVVKLYMYTALYPKATPSMFEPLLALKKLILGCTPLRSIGFTFDYLSKFKVKLLTALEYEARVHHKSEIF
jgi:hypothetical protein